MKLILIIISFFLVVSSCQENNPPVQVGPQNQGAENNQAIPLKEETRSGSGKKVSTTDTLPKQSLVLTSNALQLVDKQTGSSTEIALGKPIEQMLEIVSKVLLMEPSRVGVNTECGAGPLKMATWSNGLTLVFQEQNKNTIPAHEWRFVGWYMGESPGASVQLTTFAGIGIGSTRAEMESAYVINVEKTSLGYEFSTTAGLYGIFDGEGQQAKITSLWSGLSCNFR